MTALNLNFFSVICYLNIRFKKGVYYGSHTLKR